MRPRPVALLTAVVLVAAPQSAEASSQFFNGISPSLGLSTTGRWTFSHANGFASSQGSPTGDRTDLAVHAYATVGPNENIAFESGIFTEFQITGVPGFAFVDVTVGGSYVLEMFGKGIVQIEAYLCQGLLKQCVVNFTKIPIVSDSIFSNLMVSNEGRNVPILWNGQLIANVPYALRLRALASALEPNTQARAFIDPPFTIGAMGVTLGLDPAAQNTNANFIPPPVPEPSAALLLLPALLVAAHRRRA